MKLCLKNLPAYISRILQRNASNRELNHCTAQLNLNIAIDDIFVTQIGHSIFAISNRIDAKGVCKYYRRMSDQNSQVMFAEDPSVKAPSLG